MNDFEEYFKAGESGRRGGVEVLRSCASLAFACIGAMCLAPLHSVAATEAKPTVADSEVAVRDYDYVFRGGAAEQGDWLSPGNWAVPDGNGGYTAIAANKTPQFVASGQNPDWAPMLLDGSLMTGVDADGDGLKHVTAASELEGYKFRLGVYNNVSLAISSLAKLQKDGWIYVDATSKLTIGGFGSKYKGNTTVLHVAAREGVTFASTVALGDLRFAYCFEGAGSVAYKGAVSGGSHTLREVALSLSPDVAGGATCVRSRTLVTYHESSSISFSVSSSVRVNIADALGGTVSANVKSEGSSLSSIGDVWFSQERNAFKVYYVDYGEDGVVVPATDRMTAIQTESSYYRNNTFFQPLIGLRVDSTKGGQVLKSVKARVSDATATGAITDVKLYATSVPYFAPGLATDYWDGISKTIPSGGARTISVSFSASKGPSITKNTYLWLAVLINPNVPVRGEIDAEITEVALGDATSTTKPQILDPSPAGAGEIYPYDWHVTPYWRMNDWTLNALTARHMACYTDIIAFYCVVKNDGTIGHGWNGEQFTDEKLAAAVARMKELRGNRDVRILVSIAWCKDALHSVTADPVLRSRMAENLAAFVDRFGFDGVDFDWEYPESKADWENWCLAVAELKPRLFALGGGKQVSISVTGYRMNQAANSLGAGNALKGLFQQCNFVCTMSYDSNSSDGHAPQWLMQNDVQKCQDFGGLKNCKIAAGQAFYTNYYPDAPNTQYGFNWVVNNYPQHVDSTDVFQADDGRTVTYNSLKTIRKKVAWCRESGVGVMIWANETDVAITHPKSATRALASQIGPMTRGREVAVAGPEDWVEAAATDGTIELLADISLDAETLRPGEICGTLNGNGHTIVLVGGNEPLCGRVTGTISNLTVVAVDGFIGTALLADDAEGATLVDVVQSDMRETSAVATVMRAHPRLTRGLARESLIGLRFDNNWGGAYSAFEVKFRLVNCTKADISDIRLWRQPFDPVPYAFYEAQAKQLAQAVVDADAGATEFTASFAPGTTQIYPCVGTRPESDYLWVTATINPDISPDAEIWVSIPTAEITLGNSRYVVVNGAETAPHRILPFVYQVGAYMRQNLMSAVSASKLEDASAERTAGLTDIILIDDVRVKYDSGRDLFTTTWDGRGRDNTAQAARVRTLRNLYNPKCMVRACLTKGDNVITVDGVTGYPIACAAASAARRKQLVESILSLLEENSLDGLDIDWEYPGDHVDGTGQVDRDWNSYGLLLRDLAAAFFDRGYVLSFCSNLGYRMAPNARWGAFHAADFVNSMAYGSSPLNASPQVMKTGISVCTSRGVPKRRIVVGQAMYAYENHNPGWSSVAGWLEAAYLDDVSRRWDADLVMRNGTTKETFEGPSSYHAKCNWCRANDYGGVMSWGYYTDVAWNDPDLMSLARHQANAIWPETAWSPPDPPQDAEGTYLLDSEDDFRWLRMHGDVSARLTADITLAHDPLPIEEFSGTLDGDGHALIVPADVWLTFDDMPALIRVLTGTVKDLRIDFAGRAVNRASRWNDTTAETSENTLSSDDHHTAVLAAIVRNGAVVDGVELILREGSEVQGPTYVGGLFGSVFCAAGYHVEVRNCRVQVGGTIRALARNTAEGDIHPANVTVGGLAGWISCPGSGLVAISNNVVVLEATGRIATETGATTSAGGMVGHVNNANPVLRDNLTYVAAGAVVANNHVSATDSLKRSYGAASWNSPSGANLSPGAVVLAKGAAKLSAGVGGISEKGVAAYVLTDEPQDEDTHLQIAAFELAAGGTVSLVVENAGDDDVEISAAARPVVQYLSLDGGEASVLETVRPDAMLLENGAMSFALPAPSVNRNPTLFRVFLTP